MSKVKEEKEVKQKFDKKTFKENFIKGEMFHGLLIDPKEINKIKSTEKTILFKFFYHQNKFKLKFLLFYGILEYRSLICYPKISKSPILRRDNNKIVK